MSPTIVLKDGQVRMVTGSPGGRTIPNTVLWTLLRVLEFGQEPQDAIKSKRTHHAWFPDVLKLEGDSWDPSVVQSLRKRGHKTQTGGTQGDAHSIVVDPRTGQRIAAPDPRRGTSKGAGQ